MSNSNNSLNCIEEIFHTSSDMKIKPLKQKGGNACGPTCIKMAADYFGVPLSIEKIARISKYKTREGLSNAEIVDALKKLGFRTQQRKNVSWQDLQRLNTKDSVLILSWMLKGYIGHVSVLEKVTKDHVFLADPEAGKIIKFPKIVFLRLWFDYDEMWYPKKNTDIQLRWLVSVRE